MEEDVDAVGVVDEHPAPIAANTRMAAVVVDHREAAPVARRTGMAGKVPVQPR